MDPCSTSFLSQKGQYVVRNILYDYLSFVLFLVFLLVCFLLGRPLYFLDKKLKTNCVDQLIRFFEYFAK